MRPAVLALLLCLSSSYADAGTILVGVETSIHDDGQLEWRDVLPSISDVLGGAVPGIPGLIIEGHTSGSFPFEHLNPGFWNGHFSADEPVMWTAGGPMTFSFNAGITGFGVQLEANTFGAFTARIEAFGANNNLLADFTVPGYFNPDPASLFDDSAVFIGVLSTEADIRRIVLSVPAVENFSPNSFGINDPRIQAAPITPVPEPGSMAVLGFGVSGLLVCGRRRRSLKQ